MPDIKKKLIDVLYIIEEKPGMIFFNKDFTYAELKYYLHGYLHCIQDMTLIPVDYDFSGWINSKHPKKTSIIWSEYIYRVLAKEDDKKAIKILIKEFKEFVNTLAV